MSTQSKKVCGIHHIALRVSNLETTISFYTHAFGFQVIAQWNNGVQDIAMLDTGNGTILEVFGAGVSSGSINETQSGAFFHLALDVEDVDTVYAVALQSGAKEKIPPRDMTLPAKPQPMPIRNAFLYGPDGESIELFYHYPQ